MKQGSVCVDLPREVTTSAIALDALALELLRGDEPFSAESIHQVRVTTKRLRAHWNMVRPELRKKDYLAAKERLRLAAKCVAGQRDATVMLATFDELIEAAHSAKLRHSLVAVRQAAEEFFAAETAQVPGATERQKLIEALDADRRQWEKLELGRADASLLEHGLRDTYARARRSGRFAARGQRSEDFHRWRRWTKYLFYQLEVIERFDPERLSRYIRELKSLGKLLGRSQDYAVTRRLVRDKLDLQKQDQRRALSAIDRKDRSVLRRSRALRARLFDRRPGKFVGALSDEMGLAAGGRR